ncbi:DUF2142 domain-containing protein [Candidatus Saccharibacteria bacterium]|nr:DUF2142 domain-containing protein [Candidatus Saccharibacteria bacterium]
MRRYAELFLRVLASRKFFIVIVGLLVFQAVWLALSFNYPMLWDEYYHFGLAQFYAHHINPIITHQPESLDLYGNVARSPKYFYHYLMSFPLRGFSVFTSNEMAQVIFLRFINIAMFAGGLVAFRQAMLRITKSRAMVHLVLLLVVLFPMSALLAAEVNYDNLQFLLTGLVLYWTFRFTQAKKFEVSWLLAIIGVGSLASIVKYTFLPIFAALLGYMFVHAWRRWGLKGLFQQMWSSYKKLGRWTAILLTLLVVVGVGLATERFGVNFVSYHKIDPTCSRVISEERCLSFSPFKQELLLGNEPKTESWQNYGPLGFTYHYWLHDIYIQYFTTGTQLAYEQFAVPSPFHIPLWTILFVMIVAIACFVRAGPRFWRRHEVELVLVMSVALALALWLVDFEKYHRTGYPLAIQGRYLLPIVPQLMLIGAMAVDQTINSRKIKLILAAIAVVGLAWGGGLITHIVLSQPSWMWQNQLVLNVNHALQTVLSPFFW